MSPTPRMTQGYFVPEQRAEKVRQLFTRIAPRYDLINDIQSFGLHHYWKRQLIRLSGVQPGQSVLDVCTGTGDVAFLFATAGARVTGFDFTEAMLARAQERKSARPVHFVRGDALALPFPDQTFDVVAISYGLRNLADYSKGVSELHRVAKPGGRILILDFGKPDNAAWRSLYFSYLKVAVPLFGRLFCGDAAAYAYILESLHHYPAQRGVHQLLRQLQCRNARIHNFLGGVMSINYAERG